MFTGLVEEIGIVKKITEQPNLMMIEIQACHVPTGLKRGDSIAVDGVCLTVAAFQKEKITFECMLETLKVTTLGLLQKNDKVHLERALKVSDRLGGHIVSGHVDDAAQVQRVVKKDNYVEYIIKPKREFMKYIVPKGSICLSGISLTVGKVTKTAFSVYLIPETLRKTMMGEKRKGSRLNLEVDLLARYAEKLLEEKGTS